jgi:hypothetical protein
MTGLPLAHDCLLRQLASRAAMHTCVLMLRPACPEHRVLRVCDVLALSNALGTLPAADSARGDPPSRRALRAIYT